MKSPENKARDIVVSCYMRNYYGGFEQAYNIALYLVEEILLAEQKEFSNVITAKTYWIEVQDFIKKDYNEWKFIQIENANK